MKSRRDGVRFRKLGEHRIRGLPEPVALFQVAAKGLAASFPEPRTVEDALTEQPSAMPPCVDQWRDHFFV